MYVVNFPFCGHVSFTFILTTVPLRLRIDCDAITEPSRQVGATGLLLASQESQEDVQGAKVVPNTLN